MDFDLGQGLPSIFILVLPLAAAAVVDGLQLQAGARGSCARLLPTELLEA